MKKTIFYLRLILALSISFNSFAENETDDLLTVALVSADLEDVQTLKKGLLHDHIIEFNKQTDPWTIYMQLNEIASKEMKMFDQIAIFSHGNEGEFDYGNKKINKSNLADLDLYNLGAVMSRSKSELLIYACNLGKGQLGADFFEALKGQMIEKIFISNDLSGKNGNWDLELSSKNVTYSSRINKKYLTENYNHNLQCPKPTITTVTPLVDLVESGVTISGTGLAPGGTTPTVYLGAVQATVISFTDTEVFVQVPYNASYQRIQLINDCNLVGYGTFPFILEGCDISLDASSYGTPGDAYIAPGSASKYYLQHCDLDNDGLPEVIANWGTVWPNISTPGNVNYGAPINYGSSGRTSAVGDFDGDGKIDIATTGISVSRNTSAGSLSFAPALLFSSSGYYQIFAGDVDGDGKVDIVTTNRGSAAFVHRNISTGPGNINFATQVAVPSPGACGIVIGDLDGDGKAEVITSSVSNDEINVHQNNSTPGTISLGAAQPFTTGTSGRAYRVVMGDVNNDGKLDLAANNWSGGNSIGVYTNTSTGIGNFGFSTATYPSSDPYRIAIGDLNADGHVDIATLRSGGNSVDFYVNDGTGTFSNYSFITGASGIGISIGDLDGDVIPEIMLGIGQSFRAFITSGLCEIGAICPEITVDVTPTNLDCFGYDYQLTVIPSGGTEPYSVTASGGTPSTTQSNTFLFDGFTTPTNTVSISVIDANGCEANLDYELTNPIQVVAGSAVSTPASCATTNDGSVTYSGQSGGTPHIDNPEFPTGWSYFLLGPNGLNINQSSPTFTNLAPGFYDVGASDANGCGTGLFSIEVIFVDTEAPVIACQDLTVELDGNGMAFIVPDDLTSLSGADNLTTYNWLGWVNVLNYGYGFPAGLADIKSTVDVGTDAITLQPNFIPLSGLNDEIVQGNTYLETVGTLTGTAFEFTGSVLSNDLDPKYDAFAFIRFFSADFSSFFGEITAPLVAGNDFSVVHDGSIPGAVVQYGFTVVGITGFGSDESSLGSAVVQGIALNTAFDNCGIASMVASQTEFGCDDLGDNTVTLTVTDVNGLVSTCTSTVTVEDNRPQGNYDGDALGDLCDEDDDNDGCDDIVDPHPFSIQTTTVVIGGCDSGVANQDLGCSTLADILMDICQDSGSYSEYRENVSRQLLAWKRARIITRAERTAIYRCAIRNYNDCAGTPVGKGVVASKTMEIGAFAVNAYPNPSGNAFTIKVTGSSDEQAQVRILDITGKTVETIKTVANGAMLQVGERLSGGIYFAEIVQGENRKVVKLIKQN